MKFLFNFFTKKKEQINTPIIEEPVNEFKTIFDLDKLPNFKAGISIREMYQEPPEYFNREVYDKLKKITRETKYDNLTISVINDADPIELIKRFGKWRNNKMSFSDEVYYSIKERVNKVSVDNYNLTELYNFFTLTKFLKIYFYDNVYRDITNKIYFLQEAEFIPNTYHITPVKASIYLNSKMKIFPKCFSPNLFKAIDDLKDLNGYAELKAQKANISSRLSKAKKNKNLNKLADIEIELQFTKNEISLLIKNYFIYLSCDN